MSTLSWKISGRLYWPTRVEVPASGAHGGEVNLGVQDDLFVASGSGQDRAGRIDDHARWCLPARRDRGGHGRLLWAALSSLCTLQSDMVLAAQHALIRGRLPGDNGPTVRFT